MEYYLTDIQSNLWVKPSFKFNLGIPVNDYNPKSPQEGIIRARSCPLSNSGCCEVDERFWGEFIPKSDYDPSKRALFEEINIRKLLHPKCMECKELCPNNSNDNLRAHIPLIASEYGHEHFHII